MGSIRSIQSEARKEEMSTIKDEKMEMVWIGFSLGELCAQLAILGQQWGLTTMDGVAYLQRSAGGEQVDQIKIPPEWTQHDVVDMANKMLHEALDE